METTICAVATAVGTGAVSIIRCSGPLAIKIVNGIFRGNNLAEVSSHSINYGYIIDQSEIIDEVLVSVMKAPKTFTKEDVVEINSHGGMAITNRILELLLTKGCILAEPGEFTKRAFLNGRIDLLEAEAISDLITAETEKARKLAINQMAGQLTKKIAQIRAKILEVQAKIEVNIDYPEYEEAQIITIDSLKPVLKEIQIDLTQLLEESKKGEIIKNGINVTIIGQPNVGKSSILNALLNEERAIVTNIPGTTRDSIEGQIILDGIVLNLIDTAGIRQTDDVVEKIGVQRSIELSKNADLVIYVLDNSASDFSNDLTYLTKLINKKIVVFLNKSDLNSTNDYRKFKKYNFVKGNTVRVDGLNPLKKKIVELFSLEQLKTTDFSYLSNARQISLVKKALESINSVLTGLAELIPIDLVTIDLKNCYDSLGEIIGETYQDDLLNELFSKFCLGK